MTLKKIIGELFVPITAFSIFAIILSMSLGWYFWIMAAVILLGAALGRKVL